MIVKLKSGSFLSDGVRDDNSLGYVEKRALLVYEGQFDSLDGEVEITKDHVDLIVETHNGFLSKLKRLATGEIPIKNCPPIQLDHSTSAWDTVGRLTGELENGEFETEDGKKVRAVYGNVRILGKDNVERVEDGRWSNLSIGADLETGKLSELTITPFPAAPQATLMSQKRLAREKVFEDTPDGNTYICVELDPKTGKFHAIIDDKEIGQYPSKETAEDSAREAAKNKIVKLSKESSEGGNQMDKEKLKKYLMDEKKMSADDAEKELSRLESSEDKEELSRLQSDADEHEKKMSAEGDEKDKEAQAKKMAAAKATIARLSTDFRKDIDNAKLAAKSGKILTRLSRLRAAAKITPAEIKKMDIAKLAAKGDEVIDATLQTYEDREPVVMVGSYGSVKAEDIANLSSKVRMSRLEMETRKNMTMLKGTLTQDDKEAALTSEGEEKKVDMAALNSAYEEMCKMMDEGKYDDVKAKLKSYLSSGSGEYTETNAEETEKQLSAMMENVTKMQSKFDEIAKVTESLLV